MLIKIKKTDTLINFDNITRCYIGGYAKLVLIFKSSIFFQVDSVTYKNKELAQEALEKIETGVIKALLYIEI